MVSVRGQLDAPLVDISSVREGYWQRKEMKLPSLAKFHKKKRGWFSWFRKEEVPKVVLTRLGQSDFDKIDGEFIEVKADIAKDGPAMNRIVNKVMEGKGMTDEETKFMVDCSLRVRPYLIAMLTEMIIEPEMNYEEVRDMTDALDDYDANSLYALVNAMTSEKARALKYVYEERNKEMAEIRGTMRTGV